MIEQNKNEDIEMNDNKTEIKERFLIDIKEKWKNLIDYIK